MVEEIKVLTEFVDEDECWTIDRYLKAGGYEAARKACKDMQPDEIIDFVKQSGLRGRGGAGFPAGLKWSFVPRGNDKPKFLVLNGDESEPGTFKDQLIMKRWPHSIIEGSLIACRAVGISTIYLYIRGEMPLGYTRLVDAVEEAYEKGFLGKDIFGIKGFDVDMTIHRGAGAYICGEETGMLSSLEGGRGYPKLKPPFPAVSGLFGLPTVVNNVVTIAYLPYIFERGLDWWRGIGTEKSTGLMPYSISGHVKSRGVYELPLGTSLKDMFELAGGWDRPMKAVIPGGSSSKVMKLPDCWDCPMCFEGPMEMGSMLGSAAVVFMDETVCMVDALHNVLRFYEHESCGQCTPCREGTGWSVKIVKRIVEGRGRPGDIDTLLGVADRAIGKTICVFAEAFGWPIQSYVALFRDEFEAYIKNGGGPATKRAVAAAGAH
jgi:NADH-quinone oxidoreductase subunit F